MNGGRPSNAAVTIATRRESNTGSCNETTRRAHNNNNSVKLHSPRTSECAYHVRICIFGTLFSRVTLTT